MTATDIRHDSDCAQHNEPAYPNGPCDCSAASTGQTDTQPGIANGDEPKTPAGDTVTVPREPTEAMLQAGEQAAWDDDNSMPAIRAMPRAWAAMLSAAPAALQPSPVEKRSVAELETLDDWLAEEAAEDQAHDDLRDRLGHIVARAITDYEDDPSPDCTSAKMNAVKKAVDEIAALRPVSGGGLGCVMAADDAPVWADGLITDGERSAFAQKAEADYGGTYWATDEGNGAIEWEPTHFIALYARQQAAPDPQNPTKRARQ